MPARKRNKTVVENPHLQTWVGLNEHIMTCGEDECEKLLGEELQGRARKMFIHRIHARLNLVRAERERKELGVA